MSGVATLHAVPRLEEVLRLLGYPEGRLPSRPIALLLEAALAEARELARPRGAWVSLPVAEAARVGLEAIEAHGLVIGLVTAGPGIEERASRYLHDGDGTMALLLDATGSALAEQAADELGALAVGDPLTEGAPALSCRISPGYGRWHLQSQRELFELLPHRELGVELTPSCLMVPCKSVSFAMWLGADARPIAGLSGCARCQLAHCRYRRAA